MKFRNTFAKSNIVFIFYNFLHFCLDSSERWLGALYDWKQMTWRWAASGKPLTFQAFGESTLEDKEQLRWHCIIMDPKLQYKYVFLSLHLKQ